MPRQLRSWCDVAGSGPFSQLLTPCPDFHQSCVAAGHAGCQTCPGRLEVLGSRKAARPGLLPLPNKYTVLLDMFGECQPLPWHT